MGIIDINASPQNIIPGNERFQLDDQSNVYSVKLNQNNFFKELAQSGLRNHIKNQSLTFGENNIVLYWNYVSSLQMLFGAQTTLKFRYLNDENNIFQTLETLIPNTVYTLVFYYQSDYKIKISVSSDTTNEIFDSLQNTEGCFAERDGSTEIQKIVLKFKTGNCPSGSVIGPITFKIETNEELTLPETEYSIVFHYSGLNEGDIELGKCVDYTLPELAFKYLEDRSKWGVINDGITFEVLATENYVNGAIQGFIVKSPAKVATSEDITLFGIQTIDDVEVQVGDRVLVKSQIDKTKNGLYNVQIADWYRTSDFNVPIKVRENSFVFIEQGTINSNNGYLLITENNYEVDDIQCIDLDATDLLFAQFTGAGQIDAGAGLSKTGNQININTVDQGRIQVNADSIDLGEVFVDQQAFSYVIVDKYGRVINGEMRDPIANSLYNTEVLSSAIINDVSPPSKNVLWTSHKINEVMGSGVSGQINGKSTSYARLAEILFFEYFMFDSFDVTPTNIVFSNVFYDSVSKNLVSMPGGGSITITVTEAQVRENFMLYPDLDSREGVVFEYSLDQITWNPLNAGELVSEVFQTIYFRMTFNATRILYSYGVLFNNSGGLPNNYDNFFFVDEITGLGYTLALEDGVMKLTEIDLTGILVEDIILKDIINQNIMVLTSENGNLMFTEDNTQSLIYGNNYITDSVTLDVYKIVSQDGVLKLIYSY